jgi:hypothetical protein
LLLLVLPTVDFANKVVSKMHLHVLRHIPDAFEESEVLIPFVFQESLDLGKKFRIHRFASSPLFLKAL